MSNPSNNMSNFMSFLWSEDCSEYMSVLSLLEKQMAASKYYTPSLEKRIE